MWSTAICLKLTTFRTDAENRSRTSIRNLIMNSIPRPEFPRPQFEREDWINLNGEWTYCFDFGHSGRDAGRELYKTTGFADKIIVPFCPESKLSGVGYTDFIEDMWYHRKISIPQTWAGRRTIIHFGAVDFESELYIDGVSVGKHYGGTVSFEFDITGYVKAGKEHDLVLRVHDETKDYKNDQPSGKQAPWYRSGGCSYTRTTGIWQTVWLEAVAMTGLKNCHIIPVFDNGTFVITPSYYAQGLGNIFRATALNNGEVVASAETVACDCAQVSLKIENAKSWSPESPFLYDLRLEVLDENGVVIDSVKSYAGMRKVHIDGNQVYLNNKPLYQRLVLDQGFYPDGIWTAPADDDLKHDIELSMAAGFNGARLHQKVFEERFHYWADKLGYITWGESSSWGCDPNNIRAARHFLPEWAEIVVRDRNHPSIITWTPFNETCLGPDYEHQARTTVDAYKLTKMLDPTRPVNDASGWLHFMTDIWTIHDYARGEALKKDLSHADGEVWQNDWIKNLGARYSGQPYLIDEFGGLKWIPKDRAPHAENTWGYGNDIPDLETLYSILKDEVDTILGVKTITGYCYTQLTDVEQEQNGVYNYDRTAKFDMEKIREIFSRNP